MALPRYGSSPEPSTMRPQRGSRATSTIGAKVQCTPLADASMAATWADRSAAAGFQLAASASGTGKMVRKPWMTSWANRRGMGRGEDGAEAVDDVGGKWEGEVRARFPPREPLELPGAVGADDVQKRADLAPADLLGPRRRAAGAGRVAQAGELVELADLLGQRQAREHRVHKALLARGCPWRPRRDAVRESEAEQRPHHGSPDRPVPRPGARPSRAHPPFHPGPLTIFPGLAPVTLPSLTTATPFTRTYFTPSESWWGFSYVDRLMIVFG